MTHTNVMNYKFWQNRYFYVVIQLIFPFLLGSYSVYLGQDINWDLQNYHLYNPYAFLNDRTSFDLAAAGLQTYFNPTIDLVYFFIIQNFPPKVFGFLLGFFQGFNFILLFNIGRLCLRELVVNSKVIALSLATLGVLSVGFLSEIGTTLGDNVVSVFVLLSLFLIIKAIMILPTSSVKQVGLYFFLSGIVMGAGVGFKITVAIYSVGLILSIFFVRTALKRKLFFIITCGVGLVFGFLVTGGFWYYKVYQEFGNPLFPIYNNIFSGELAESLPIKDERFLPKNMVEKVFYPVVFTANHLSVAELKYREVSWLLIYVLVIIFLFNRLLFSLQYIKSTVLALETKYLLSFFVVSYILWLNLFGIYRYLIAIEIIIPLLFLLVTLHLLNIKRISALVLTLLFVVTIFNLGGVVSWGRSPWNGVFYETSFDRTLIQKESVGSVVLIGQPLAWIAPVLNLNVPFVQIMPNFPTTSLYLNKAKSIIDLDSKKVLIFYDETVVMKSTVDLYLKNVNLDINDKDCWDSEFYLASQKSVYKTCIVKPI